MRTPLVVMAVLGVALLGLDLAFGESGGSPSPRSREPAPAPVATIAHRVEALRRLRYRRIPVPQRVSGAQARRDGLADYDASEPEHVRAAEEEVLERLGLVPAGTSLRGLAASLYGEGVAGYYDPRSKRLKVVAGAATSTRALTETVIAHELTHALEDQRYGLGGEGPSEGDDRALARLALVEGTATEVMTRYGARWIPRGELLASAIGSAFAPTASQPPFLEAQTVFPYVAGQRFVEDLLRRAGGRWALLDDAERLRPPDSTEQILHPERYLRVDRPERVRLRAGRVLGGRWTRVRAGTWGEYATRELLADGGGGGAEAAAAGWGGDRWELWRSRPLLGSGCRAPCRAADVLVLRWRWDTPRDQREFAARLRVWSASVRERLGAGLATATGLRGVTLVLAPDDALARRVARRG
jgi:hypothetical protein